MAASDAIPSTAASDARLGPDSSLNSDFESSAFADRRDPARRDQRQRDLRLKLAIVTFVLLALLALLVRALASTPRIDATWHSERGGAIELVSSPLPALRMLAGAHLEHIGSDDAATMPAAGSLMLHTPRWTVQDAQRESMVAAQQQLSSMLRQGAVVLSFANGGQARVAPAVRGLAGLGPVFWLCAALALAMTLAAAAVWIVHPHARNLPYAVIALCQSANLLVIGVETMPGLGLPVGFIEHAFMARAGFDLFSAAAMVHLSTLQPLRLPAAGWIAAATWLGSAGLLTALWADRLAGAWAWTQAGMVGCGLLTIALLTWSYRIEPNPFAVLMRRLALAATATLTLLSVAVAVASRQGSFVQGDAAHSSVIWYLFLTTLTLLLPVFSRAQPLMRELAMLAGTSAVATSLDLLFVSTFGLGPFASLSLSVFFALAVYAGTRHWLLQPMSGPRVAGAERMFEKLYRVLREVEARPGDSAELLSRLLRDLFEPLQVQRIERRTDRSRVLGSGSALLVPVPEIGATRDAQGSGSMLLRYAAHGKRMFSRDDARLTDRVVEQLRRAVAYDKAVERGRSEERLRIAQDLHDDIGARLLTLMYKAQSPEMEDYLRHTLKDLKTLTRGLAASDQRLSHATAEWKSDIGQRLAAAQIELGWAFNFDQDIVLSVVQWSALTRVLRELVSNAIAHSCATHVDIAASLEGGRLRLTVADDGIGRSPDAWSHGLGLGGVRKRVKLLGGNVQWAENGSAGIVCTVLVADLEAKH